MRTDEQLVSVIIPAYNSETTLIETLRSVRAQTHSALEIIVVDDGSKDRTREVAEAEADQDSRIRVISQTNGGVAKARNRGIEEARGDVIAPVDADDLWRPRKIERQLRALNVGGPETGLVYCWSAVIDGQSRISSSGGEPLYQGDVLPQLFYGNFVGNGSSALMRKKFVMDAGGYDANLKARRAQGCEDWKLYLLLAERSHFGVIRDQLVGYRYASSAMSGDVSQMLRSDALVRTEFSERHPNYRSEIAWGRRYYLQWLLYREAENGNWANCRKILQEEEASLSWLQVIRQTWRPTARFARRRLRSGRAKIRKGEPFLVQVSTARIQSGHAQDEQLVDRQSDMARVAERLERM
jgi:glycosyltransferase involved in cell wall biosynthesis